MLNFPCSLQFIYPKKYCQTLFFTKNKYITIILVNSILSTNFDSNSGSKLVFNLLNYFIINKLTCFKIIKIYLNVLVSFFLL